MIVASIATLSSREKLLEQSVASLLPQVDALCVYLNGHQRIPAFLNHPKVLHTVLSLDAGWRGGEAKLWFHDQRQFKANYIWSPDDTVLTCDDDIVYPPDYAERHCALLAEKPRSLSCVHGTIIVEPIKRYLSSRRVTHFAKALSMPAQVHVPGTGTMAFRRGDFDINMKRDIRWSHCDDIMVGIAAKKQGLECWSVAREAGWMVPLKLPAAGTEVYGSRIGALNDANETRAVRTARPWPVLPVSEEFTGVA